MDYLIVVDYQSDAERKRIDYAIERWKDRVMIEKPHGTVIHFSGADVDEFLDDLYSRLSVGKDSVHVFAGYSYSPNVSEQVEELKYSTYVDALSVEKFLNYIMIKIGASYEETKNGIKRYTAYTKKGQVGIEISLKSKGKSEVVIVVKGYGEVVTFITRRIDKELKVFLGE